MSSKASERSFQGYSRVLSGRARCFRPEKLSHVKSIIDECRASGCTITARGAGLSYGDASFCDGGAVVDFSRLNRIHAADWNTGALIVEPGLLFREVFKVAGPRGWSLAVTPGTSSVSIGGAVAMDIHGKNHRRAGGFSQCVMGIDLRLADGGLIHCSRNENQDVFKATIGGLGKTGFIERIHLTLSPVTSNSVVSAVTPVNGVDEALSTLDAHRDAEWVVYWGDLLNASAPDFIKGAVIISRSGEPAHKLDAAQWAPEQSPPLHLLAPVYNTLSNRVFNALYGRKLRAAKQPSTGELRSHLFTWDKLHNWNRLYGRSGFFEYQFVVPYKNRSVIEEVMTILIAEKIPAYLFAMKLMQAGEGDLSYGAEDGVSVLFDTPASPRAKVVLKKLDGIIAANHGRVHLAKDSRLDAAAVESIYGDSLDAWRKVIERVDPQGLFSSAMSRRLGLDRAQ